MSALPSYTGKLHSKRVLVIGGTSGIGFGVACAAYDNGAQVIVSSSSPEKVSRAVERILAGYPSHSMSTVEGIVCDLADPVKLEENLKSLLEQATRNGLPLDHIAFTAGNVPELKLLSETSVENIQSFGIVRFIAPIILSKLILRRNQEGSSKPYLPPSPDSSLTFTSGSSAKRPEADGWGYLAGYAAGIEGTMRSLSKDLRPIRVNVVAPGAVETELFAKFPAERRDALMEILKKSTSTGRLGRPEDLAEAYLCCMKDGFITGSVICSDGGRRLS